MANYTSQTRIEDFLGRSLTSSESANIQIVLDSVDAFINDEIGGSFGSVSETTRYYDGGEKILDVEYCQNISKVASVDTDETELTVYVLNEDYESKPRNETTKAWIERRSYTFPKGVSNIAVTAEFTRGDTVPNDIIYLATVLSARQFQTSAKEGLKKESIEGYSREWKDSVLSDETIGSILDQYKGDDLPAC